MGSYKIQSTNQGELMTFLLRERPRFATDEEFKTFALAEVRRFISDLRSINIELTLRPTYFGKSISLHAPDALIEY